MHGYRRTILWILLLVFVFSFIGCDKKPKVVTSQAKHETKSEPTEPTPEFVGLNVFYGDTVEVKLYVYLAKHLYFNGPKPVRVLVPGNTPFEFSQNEYFVKRPIFPMKVKFDVPRGVPGGIQKIPLGLKLMFCNKADDVCIIKNDFIPIELMVHPKSGPVKMTYEIEKTYEVD